MLLTLSVLLAVLVYADAHKTRVRAVLETSYEGFVRLMEDPWLFVWHLHLVLTLIHFIIWISSYGWVGGAGPSSLHVSWEVTNTYHIIAESDGLRHKESFPIGHTSCECLALVVAIESFAQRQAQQLGRVSSTLTVNDHGQGSGTPTAMQPHAGCSLLGWDFLPANQELHMQTSNKFPHHLCCCVLLLL
jgi:hypothetical protein